MVEECNGGVRGLGVTRYIQGNAHLVVSHIAAKKRVLIVRKNKHILLLERESTIAVGYTRVIRNYFFFFSIPLKQHSGIEPRLNIDNPTH